MKKSRRDVKLVVVLELVPNKKTLFNAFIPLKLFMA
jgi:hypothetical protein